MVKTLGGFTLFTPLLCAQSAYQGVIAGSVRDSISGAPVADAELSVLAPGKRPTARTDSSGAFPRASG